MTTDNNFAGRDGHVTFVGVVEGRDDPAKMGRLRVRIIGLHTDDTNLVPTEELPWAQIVAPINGSRSFSLPKDGEWVHGFFQDGYNSQMPVVTGIFVGIQSEEPKVDDGSVAKIEQLQKELDTETATLNGILAGSASNSEQKKANQQKIIDDYVDAMSMDPDNLPEEIQNKLFDILDVLRDIKVAEDMEQDSEEEDGYVPEAVTLSQIKRESGEDAKETTDKIVNGKLSYETTLRTASNEAERIIDPIGEKKIGRAHV